MFNIYVNELMVFFFLMNFVIGLSVQRYTIFLLFPNFNTKSMGISEKISNFVALKALNLKRWNSCFMNLYRYHLSS